MAQAGQGQAVAQCDEVSRKDLPFEFMLNALRLREGFSLEDFRDRTGLPLSSIEPGLKMASDKGWITLQGQLVKPTPLGFDFLSDVQALFLG